MRFTVELLVDGAVVGANEGDVPTSFSTATLLLGERSGGFVTGSEVVYDEARVVRDEANLLGNSGFEADVGSLSVGMNRPAIFGNWRGYRQASSLGIVSSPVAAGAKAARMATAGGGSDRGGYFYQDVELEVGDLFDVDVRVYPVANDTQAAAVLFDWNRDDGVWSGEASVVFGAAGTTFEAWGIGGSAPPLPRSTWSHVILRLSTIRSGWQIGKVGL